MCIRDSSEIAALKSELNGKVIAYLSIGQAEDYRWYWQREWRKKRNAPDWFVGPDKRWKGNFYVRYWDDDWRQIILDYVDRILAQGFDGVYLDCVDAYEVFESQ